MAKQYNKEQFWKLYEKLPEELKEAVFSENTANDIFHVCEKNEVSEEKIPEIAKCAGHVLLGILPPDKFQETLEKELKLKAETAKKVAQEINRFIFYPVKSSLEELFKIEITPAAKPKVAKRAEAAPPAEEKPSVPQKEDAYRELIE